MLNYSSQPIVNDKPAIRVKAEFIDQRGKAIYLDIEGDKKWIPLSLCEYNEDNGTVDIVEWFYKTIFPNG